MLTFEYPIHRRMSTKIFIIGYEFDDKLRIERLNLWLVVDISNFLWYLIHIVTATPMLHRLRPDLVPYTITNFRHIRINKIVLRNDKKLRRRVNAFGISEGQGISVAWAEYASGDVPSSKSVTINASASDDSLRAIEGFLVEDLGVEG